MPVCDIRPSAKGKEDTVGRRTRHSSGLDGAATEIEGSSLDIQSAGEGKKR